MRILIAGAAGRLGRKLAKDLGADHELVLGDIVPLDDPRFVRLDVTDLDASRAAARGCDAIVYMAILDWPPCSAREAMGYTPAALQVHAVGVANLLQAAVEGGIGRFVYISSVSAVDGLPPQTRVGSDTRHYSNAVYGLTKGFGEDLCRMFHRALGLSVAVLRLGTIYIAEAGGAWIGNVFRPDASEQPPVTPGSSRVHGDDVTRAIALALQAPAPGYVLVHVVGADSGDRWDLEAARQVYGWQPRFAFGPHGLPREV